MVDDSVDIPLPRVSYVPIGGNRRPFRFNPKASETNSYVRDRVQHSYTCDSVNEEINVDELPVEVDFIEEAWFIVCPLCQGRHSGTLLAPSRPLGPPFPRVIDVPLDIDLGKLIDGQHVVLKGIETTDAYGSQIHNDFVPGFKDSRESDLDTSWSLGEVTDDLGTTYAHRGEGGWGLNADGVVRQGEESLGNSIPKGATKLTISFWYAGSHPPTSRWIQRLTLNPQTGEVLSIEYGD